MHIECPKCHTGYHLDEIDEDAVLVCHRCRHEFRVPAESAPENRLPESPVTTTPTPEPELAGHTFGANNLEEPQTSAFDTFQEATEPVHEEHTASKRLIEPAHGIVPDVPAGPQAVGKAPIRKGPSLWPWLLIILLIIAAASFWANRGAWLSDPWLRSVLMNMDVPLDVRNTDWRVTPESVQSQWVRRDDGKQILVIEGRVKNQLQAELPPPHLRLRLFAADDPAHMLSEYILPITQPPLLGAIRRAPYSAPPEDTVPVTALGDRGFILILENAPKAMGDFTLQPVTLNTPQ